MPKPICSARHYEIELGEGNEGMREARGTARLNESLPPILPQQLAAGSSNKGVSMRHTWPACHCLP